MNTKCAVQVSEKPCTPASRRFVLGFLKKLFVGSCLFFLYFIVVFVRREEVFAQVVINEVLPNPVGDDKGAEWVELYNLGPEPVSLSDCRLYLHESGETQKVVFSAEDFIDRFKVVSWDAAWLNNSGDWVRLICDGFTDSVSYGNADGSVLGSPKEGFTFGRSPDGIGGYFILTSATMGYENTGEFVPTNTPTPTLKPTPTPKPTATPKPTSTPKPTITPKPTVTPKPNVLALAATTTPGTKISATPATSRQGSGEGVVATKEGAKNDTLGVLEGGFENTTDPEVKVEAVKNKFPFAAMGVVSVGVGLMSIAFYFLIKNPKKGYNLDTLQKEDGKEEKDQ